MQFALLYLPAGIGLLYLGGNYLVRGSVALAERAGVPPLVAGLTIVAFGTSAPELAVTMDAALAGYNDIAVGNVVGSNICNVGLILGTAALISPFRVDPQLFRVDMPIMVASIGVMVWMLADGTVSRIEGGLLVLGIVAFVSLHLWMASQQSSARRTAAKKGGVKQDGSVLRDVAFVLGGLAALVVGGAAVVRGGVQLAALFGVSDAVIALTVVAVGTSLPELTVSLIAAARAHGDIAIGNVVGSNIFNTLAILGITTGVQPLVRGDLGTADLCVMLALALAVPLLAWRGRRLGRVEGASLLAVYVAYNSWLITA